MKLSRKCLAMLVAAVMLLIQTTAAFAVDPDGTISIDLATVSAGGTGYTYAGGVLTITDNGSYILTGNTSTKRVVVSAASDITLNGASITSVAGSSPLSISAGAAVNLTLSGVNTLTGGDGAAGLHVPATAAVVIDGTGTLTAKGGASSGSSNGAGIGGMGAGGNAGSITIKGGTVAATGGPYAAGIGGGNNNNGTAAGSGSNITISGGTVNATGNNHSSAIGGGCRGNGGNITISGGTVTANAGTWSAAIGGGFTGGAGNILISGGMVTATGKDSAPGIGREPSSAITDPLISGGTTSTINIIGGTVVATGAGKPGVGNSGGTDHTTLTISGGSIKSNPLPLNIVTDGSSTPVYLITVTVQTASGVLANTEVSCTTGGADFFAKTDSSGKLYLWLPAGTVNLAVNAEGSYYWASGAVLSDGTATLAAEADIPPARRSGIPGTANVRLQVNNPYTLNLADIFEDTDGGSLTYKVSVNGGTVQPANADYTYTPVSEGTTTLRFTANDGKADSSDTYTVTITATNTPPENIPPNRRSSVPDTATASITVNGSYTLDLAAIFEDEDGDPLTYKVSVNGEAAQAASRNYTYTPATEGTNTLRFTANDGKADSSDTYTVTLTVDPSITIDLATVSTGGTGYNLTTITVNSLPERVLTITAPGSYILTGTVKQGPSDQPGNPLHVEVTAPTANIVLSNASISVFNYPPMYIKSGSTVSLTLADGTTNQLRSVVTTNAGTGTESISVSGVGFAGLYVPYGAAVIIDGPGTLNAIGGAGGSGIGGSINQYAPGYDVNAGSITINGGVINATGNVDKTNPSGIDGSGAGIGGGDSGNGDTIIINGGTIAAKGGELAAGIGGGGSGIRGGGNGGSITINGGTVTANGGGYGAAIGGGNFGEGGTIRILSGMVSATGGWGGAGIGGGINSYSGGDIAISGGAVTAIGGKDGGAGIGGGRAGTCGTIVISGGVVKAGVNGSGYTASAIGGGLYGGIGGSIAISGGTVTASGGGEVGSSGVYNVDIGPYIENIYNSSLTPIITGGSVKASNILPRPTNGSTAVYLTTVTVKGPSGILADTPVSCTVGGTAFPAQTDSGGRLYLRLPQGTANLTIAAGGINYLAGGNVLSDGTTALTAWQDTPPARRSGIPEAAAASVEINRPYTLKLETIFEDANNDPMTYSVSINGGAAQPANADYTYTPTVEGTTTLRFTANDGKSDSIDTYTVTLTIALAGTIDLSKVSADGTGYTYGDNTVTIAAPGSYILTGATNAVHVVITAAAADITLRNVSIGPPSSAALSVMPNSSVSLTLEGTNTLTGAAGCAGLYVPVDAAVVIDGTGSLAAKGGARSGSSNGAGIGGMGAGGNAGSITIKSGTVAATGGPYAAGIGGGNNNNGTAAGSGGSITISGGIVDATGNDHSAGIGGGCRGDGGNITISGGTVTAKAGSWSAGIGGGFSGNTGNISITGGKVTAIGRNLAAGIGRAPEKDGGGSIVVSGGTVIATSGHSACPGIGSWLDILLDTYYIHDSTTLTISGGSVNSSPRPYYFTVTYNGSSIAYPVTVTVRGSSGVLSNTELYCKVGGNSFYAETDDSGKLYLWLPGGVADMTLSAGGIDYRAHGTVSTNGITELTARQNTRPARRDGIPDTASMRLTVNTPYKVNLADIFYDADGDALAYTVSVNGGTAQAASADYSYTPLAVGQTVLAFKANDGMADSADGYTVTITATSTQPVNTPPARRAGIPAEAAASVPVNTPYAVNLASIFEDADGDPMSYTVSVNGANPVGTFANYTYTPGAAGNIILVFKANDGIAASNDTYTVTLTAVNTPPARRTGIPDTMRVRLAVNDPYTVDLANIFYDANDDPLTYIVSVNSGDPVVTVADYVYTPVSAGDALLVFKANDGTADSADTYTVAITATDTRPENTPPARRAGVPEEEAAGVPVNAPYTLNLANIFEDADGDPMIYTVSVNGGGPVVTEADYVYTPVTAGDILLVFKANDGMADSINVYTVRLTVNEAPPQTYALAITAGTGGRITAGTNGNYGAGTIINIAAADNAGYSFDRWISTGGGSFGSATSAYTTFTMPANAAAITASFRYNGRDDSDEDRDSREDGNDTHYEPVAATPAYTADVKAVDKTGNRILDATLSITVDQNTGSAALNIGAQQGSIITGGGSVVIKVLSIPGVNSYTLGLPAEYLSTHDGKGKLTLSSESGSMILPSDMLAGLAGAEGKKVEITMGPGNKSALPEEVKAAIGDRPLLQLTMAVDGKRIEWNNPSAPVIISIPYTATADELANPESIIIWYIDGSGKAVSVPNGHYDPATGTVTFTTTHFSNYAVGYNRVNFNDVLAKDWYSKAIGFIAARKITTGTGSGSYSPDAKLTRGEFIVMLLKAYDIAPDTNRSDNFTDAGNTYYTGYLAAAKRLGISGGVGDNLFAPGKEITRQEMFTMLYNALNAIGRLPEGKAGKDLTAFTDAGDIASWAKDAMMFFVKTGTVGGNGGKLSPSATTTRAEIAQVLYNLLSK